MADFIFNNAKGKIRYYAELPASNDALIGVLVKSSGLEADSALKDYDTLSALLAAANDECDFTNYVRKTLASISVNVDDTNDRLDIDAADLAYTAPGGATNNTVGALIVCYDPDTTTGTDADLIPLSKHDVTWTTDSNDTTLVVNAAGLQRAS